MSESHWRTATYSGGNGCVSVAVYLVEEGLLK